jgi:succinate dehydrogenase / fumarate reductase iron-sulfur subunit
VQEGLTDAPGPRHALVVAKTIKQSGMLNENEVIVGTVGRFNFRGLMSIMPLGLRMASKGKVPPLFMHPVDKVAEIRTVFEALEVPVAS